jgi:zinc D-Ala-D-Ala dipeptidase
MSDLALLKSPEDVLLISDPRVLQIAIQECGEEIVDIETMIPDMKVSDRHSDNNPYLNKIRKTVAEKLLIASQSLPKGYQFMLTEGFRPISVQKMIFESYSKKLGTLYPNWSSAKIKIEATKYVAPPDTVPPHSTGGAFDITILDGDGNELDMGTEVDDKPHKTENRTYTASTKISAKARANRNLLIKILSEAGFANYDTEWWHWSYGDRYWAHKTKKAFALYHSVTTIG